MSAGGSGLSGGVPSAGGDFSAMLALMADPKALKAKYAEFEAKQKAAEDAIALLGPAADIMKLQAEAGRDRDAAKTALADAKAKATDLVDRATVAAEKLTANAQAAAQAVLDDAGKAKASADAAAAVASKGALEAAVERKALDARSKQLDAEEAAVEAQIHDLDARETAYTAKVANLMAVRDKLIAQFAEHLKTLKA